MKEKSFYYLVPIDRVNRLQRKFQVLDIPYTLEVPGQHILMPDDHIALVFPDLPVPKYKLLQMIFGEDGLCYPQ